VFDETLLKRYAIARSGLVAGSALFLAGMGERSPLWCAFAVTCSGLAAIPPYVRLRYTWRAAGVIVGDVVLPIVMAGATGREASPFLLLYYMAVILTGVVFPLRWALLTAGASTAGMFWTVVPPNTGLNGIAPELWVRICVAVGFLFTVALLSRVLGRTLRQRMMPHDPLEQRLAHIGRSSAVIVHELRNLLKPLTGAVELLEGDLKTDSRTEPVLRLIREECEAMEAYLGEFLDYTREGALVVDEIEVGTLLEGVVASVSKHPDLRAASIHIAGPSSLVLRGDAPSLRRTLANLVLNSAQAAPLGEIVVAVREEGKGDIVLEVADNGPGVPPALRERVFEPFVSGRPGGTGLGLAVARRTVERHGGTIAFEEGAQGGARFVIRLPQGGPTQAEVVHAA
jgi:signal transduction histidine kinase